MGNIHFFDVILFLWGDALTTRVMCDRTSIVNGFAILVLFPCKIRYIELQCIYNASVLQRPKQLIMVGGTKRRVYAIYTIFSAAML